MTPNYLCAPKALRNLIASVGTPAHFKILLLLRPPRDFIVASYKMFVRWGWARPASSRSATWWGVGQGTGARGRPGLRARGLIWSCGAAPWLLDLTRRCL